MKYKLHAALFIAFLLAASALPQTTGVNRTSEDATLRISTAKTEFLLGEPVRLNMRFTKNGNFRVNLMDHRVEPGTVRVFIAPTSGEFRRYVFKGWVPGPEGSWTSAGYLYSNTIFFNSKPQTAHLSEHGRLLEERGMMLTDYAFPEPGEYRIKVTQGFNKAANGTVTAERVDSNEISITVRRPEGDDVKVWELIKADLRIGFFMTSGQAPWGSPWSRTEDSVLMRDIVLAEVDRIVSEYPNSYLAGLLKVKAQEHRARRERYKLENEKRLQRAREKAISPSAKN